MSILFPFSIFSKSAFLLNFVRALAICFVRAFSFILVCICFSPSIVRSVLRSAAWSVDSPACAMSLQTALPLEQRLRIVWDDLMSPLSCVASFCSSCGELAISPRSASESTICNMQCRARSYSTRNVCTALCERCDASPADTAASPR